ncbi:MAG TPA: YggS family pyridoxal phosphate-dependent enzyme [Thermoanaerobaculia bacterium]|nr:YggS family pyridoxal phosphate-dependent enzyme [Thermoanaerobaculia bacterium]
MTLSIDEIAERRDDILRRIARAAERRGRDPAGVLLLAVTKSHPADLVRKAAAAGLTHFGENRVAEAGAKIETLGEKFKTLIWRLIGPLQTNKAKHALQYFSVVESLDRQRLAEKLNSLLAPQERRLPVLLELNVGAEESKSGAPPEAAIDLAAAVLEFPRLELRGLMAVPPQRKDPEEARPDFRRLVEIRDRLQDRFGRAFPEVSMGMSQDFEVAVEEGSTEVRLGTVLFGSREPA